MIVNIKINYKFQVIFVKNLRNPSFYSPPYHTKRLLPLKLHTAPETFFIPDTISLSCNSPISLFMRKTLYNFLFPLFMSKVFYNFLFPLFYEENAL